MKKTLLKSGLLLLIFSTVVNINGNYKLANEEHPDINDIGNTLYLVNEEHPDMNSFEEFISS